LKNIAFQGGEMALEPTWARTTTPKAKVKGAACVVSMAFMAAMGAAFWIGAMWASQSWMAFTR
jgi:hypothetical protein